MTTDQLLNLPAEIEYFIARKETTGKEYEFSDYWRAKSHCDFYNEDDENWQIYAKIKNTPKTLPKI